MASPMSLRERLESSGSEAAEPGSLRLPASHYNPALAVLKARVHTKLLDLIDLGAMEHMPDAKLRVELKLLVEKILYSERIATSEAERQQLILAIQNEVLGLGPIEPLLADESVSDILVNNSSHVYVERHGRLELTDVHFNDDHHLMTIIEKIVSRVGRRIDESSPMVDARLPDGSRVNAVIPPLAVDGPVLSIRRFATIPLTIDDLLKFGTLTDGMAQILAALVRTKTNILISGGTGSGKTSLLNVLSAFIPHTERIVTIEDSAELKLQQPHVVRLETRPPNVEGNGEVTQRALVRNTLRMRPDRIVVGEVRGAEVMDMLQAMNTGHEGSMTTVHANTARDALTRLENLVGIAGMSVPPRTLRQQIVSALSVVIQIARLSDGRRKVVSLQEITGMEGDIISMQEIFAFEQTGIAADGKVLGNFHATGIRPRFSERLRVRGSPLADALFDPAHSSE